MAVTGSLTVESQNYFRVYLLPTFSYKTVVSSLRECCFVNWWYDVPCNHFYGRGNTGQPQMHIQGCLSLLARVFRKEVFSLNLPLTLGTGLNCTGLLPGGSFGTRSLVSVFPYGLTSLFSSLLSCHTVHMLHITTDCVDLLLLSAWLPVHSK